MASVVPNSEATQFKAGEKQVEIARQGGYASGVAKREKKTMKQMLELCLEMKTTEGKTYQELATLGLLKGAMKGNANNYELILKLLGEIEDNNRSKQDDDISKLDQILTELKSEASK